MSYLSALILEEWIEFSVKKCKVLRVARVRSVVDRDYFLGGINLNRVAVEKDLGILISHDLSLNKDVGGGGEWGESYHF